MQTFPENSQIPITYVGESTDGALKCRTNNTKCCNAGPNKTRQGEWKYPNETLVRNTASNDIIYRTRGTSVVNLNRKNGATGPTGEYCCEVASMSNPNATICVKLILKGWCKLQ